MNNQILLTLKDKLAALPSPGGLEVETQRNVLKEELQFYVLNFIYHHANYSNWIMYGGSALRICHDLDRMSVDLDFEITEPVSELFLNKFKEEIVAHFSNTYGTGSELLTIKITNHRGLRLCFHIGDDMGINHPSKQVIVKIDLNHFATPKTVTERIPINRNQLSFVIKIYNLSALMASKIAAIMLRGQRGGVGGVLYEEKGRDIYDLLWYMTKKAIPDLDYLIAKSIDVKNLRALFDTLTLKMNAVNDINLKQDLSPLFVNQIYIENWLKNWRESYLRLLGDYQINTITKFQSVVIDQDYNTGSFAFIYEYNTENGGLAMVVCNLSDYWINFKDGDISTPIHNKIGEVATFTNNISNTPASKQKKLKQYAALFYQKIETYFQKTNRIMLGDSMVTKVIRMSADNFNQKEELVLNKSALLSCELDDLLK